MYAPRKTVRCNHVCLITRSCTLITPTNAEHFDARMWGMEMDIDKILDMKIRELRFGACNGSIE